MIHPVTAASGGGKPNLLDEKSPTHHSLHSPALVCLDHVASLIIKTMSGQRAAVLIFSSLPASPKTF
jgi:hypothetical protein